MLAPGTFEEWARRELSAAPILRLGLDHGDRGRTEGAPVWVVEVGRRLFIRARRGARRPWFEPLACGTTLELQIAGSRRVIKGRPVDEPRLLEQISAAYEAKYGADPDLPRVLSPLAVGATLELVPA